MQSRGLWQADDGDDQARFLADLRALRDAAAIGYDELAAGAHYPSDILKEAENGPSLPGLPILAAYVRACGGDVPEWEERWRRLGAAPHIDRGLPVRPAGASEAAAAGARASVSIAPPDVYNPERIRAVLRGSHDRRFHYAMMSDTAAAQGAVAANGRHHAARAGEVAGSSLPPDAPLLDRDVPVLDRWVPEDSSTAVAGAPAPAGQGDQAETAAAWPEGGGPATAVPEQAIPPVPDQAIPPVPDQAIPPVPGSALGTRTPGWDGAFAAEPPTGSGTSVTAGQPGGAQAAPARRDAAGTAAAGTQQHYRRRSRLRYPGWVLAIIVVALVVGAILVIVLR
ncbi:MAG: helix-turn-helix domain-containing protein [Streptosporangiaceae bacterium]|nr:helix-turn-helix domain-containing protein [Streptosporangiaceae bacterium]